MQMAVAMAHLMAGIDAGNHQHRNRIRISLRHRGCDVGHPRTGDDETHAGLSGDARIAVGHEAGALLMARCDMTHRRFGKAAIEFHGMHARDPEYQLDAVVLQQFN